MASFFVTWFYKSILLSLRSFTWISWGYLTSTDISCKVQFRRFLPFFLCSYLFSSWNIYFFISIFSDLILFCFFLFLSSTFYHSPLSFFAYPVLSVSPAVSFFLCLSSTYFLAVFYFSPLTFFFILWFLFLPLSLSLSSWIPSWISSTFFFCSFPLYSPYSSLYLFAHMCFTIIIILLSFFSVFSTFQFFVCIFCFILYIFLSLLFFLLCSFLYSL